VTVVVFFGLLLWARPPVPKYLMLVPLAWSLGAAPPDLARGVAGDYGMLVAALITVGLIIWRDHASSAAWQSVTAWLLFALMMPGPRHLSDHLVEVHAHHRIAVDQLLELCEHGMQHRLRTLGVHALRSATDR
jgi:hypothetical protein